MVIEPRFQEIFGWNHLTSQKCDSITNIWNNQPYLATAENELVKGFIREFVVNGSLEL